MGAIKVFFLFPREKSSCFHFSVPALRHGPFSRRRCGSASLACTPIVSQQQQHSLPDELFHSWATKINYEIPALSSTQHKHVEDQNMINKSKRNPINRLALASSLYFASAARSFVDDTVRLNKNLSAANRMRRIPFPFVRSYTH